MRRRRLQDDGRAVALALELTDSALAKVDPTDTARNARMPVGYRAPTSVARITTFSFSCAWFPVKDQPAHCVLTGIRSDPSRPAKDLDAVQPAHLHANTCEASTPREPQGRSWRSVCIDQARCAGDPD
jgi:hypothetical protein